MLVQRWHGSHIHSILHAYSSACLSKYQIYCHHQRQTRIPSDDTSTPLLPSDGTYPFGDNSLDEISSTDGIKRDISTCKDENREDPI
jgi:hypothetical protein